MPIISVACNCVYQAVAEVNLIDFDFGSAPGRNDYWHTPQDTMDKISEESLLKAGMLVAELLNMLEGNVK